jgi:hypothetical protein
MAGIFWNPEVNARGKSAELSSQAVVLDVIVNEEHRDYGSSGFDVGTIRFKYLDYGGHRDSMKTGFRAHPLEVDVQSYPLIGEIVFIQKIRGNHFYSRRINVNKRLQLNTFPKIVDRVKPAQTTQDRSKTIQQAKGGQLVHSVDEPAENLTNENYQRRGALFNLKHFDGDIIVQNRYGATLRFGSSQSELALNQQTDPSEPQDGDDVILGPTVPLNNDPIIIMRVGERELPNITRNTGYGLIVEDINEDLSSFVLSTVQPINFKFASNDDVYFRSSQKLDKAWLGREADIQLTTLSGNQSLLNSGRLVLNAKTDSIILSAQQDFISLTNRDTILDTGNHFVIGAEQIHLLDNTSQGTADDHVAVAEAVIEAFENLIEALRMPGAYTATGPLVQATGIITNLEAVFFDLDKIKSELVRIQK